MSDFNSTVIGAFDEKLAFSQNYNLTVIITILGFDILENFQDEVAFIWRKRLSIMTLLYVLTRYGPLIIHVVEIHLESRTSSYSTTGATYCFLWLFVLGCTEYLFLKRALALNGNPRWLRYILTGLYIAEVVSGLVIYSLSLYPSVTLKLGLQNSADEIVNSPSGQVGVQLTTSSVFILAFGVPEIIFQSILVLVIIGTIIRHWKTWMLLGKCSLTTIIVRDGLWGFFFNLLGLLVIIIQPVWLAGRNNQPNLQWSYLTFSVTSSHLLLNIRSGAGTPGISSDAGPSSHSFICMYRSQTIKEMDGFSVPMDEN